MTRLIFAICLFFYPVTALGAFLPEYNIRAYCQQITDGSYTLQATCIDTEQSDKAALLRMNIPQQILNYCRGIIEIDGEEGSYTLLRTCVDMEMEAKQSLGY